MGLGLFTRLFVALLCVLAVGSGAQAEEKSLAYKQGVIIGYAELCNEYSGTRLDFLFVEKVKKIFRHNDDFESAYGKMASAKGYDAITGLKDCGQIPKLMKALQKLHNN